MGCEVQGLSEKFLYLRINKMLYYYTWLTKLTKF